MKNWKYSSIEIKAFDNAKIDRSKDLHNMLLIGPMGTGKTTIANCISRNTGETIYTMNDIHRIYRASGSFEDLVKAKILILDDLIFSNINYFGNISDIAQDLLKERFDRMERYDNNYRANVEDLNSLLETAEDRDNIEFLAEESRLRMNISNFDEARKRVTIVTTNLSIDDIKSAMEVRLFDRFKKFFKANVFTVNGTSNR